MIDRPILFNSEMVRAVLDGRKTQTRRVVKVQFPAMAGINYPVNQWLDRPLGGGNYWAGISAADHLKKYTQRCPYGVPGDRLWVRETWRPWHEVDSECGCCIESCQCSGKLPSPVCYKANSDVLSDEDRECGIKWHPSIHMFRKDSRILLEIVSVRVERVKDISEGDAKAEGCGPWEIAAKKEEAHRLSFTYLWDSINAKRGFGWDANPWVWVVEFKRISQ